MARFLGVITFGGQEDLTHILTQKQQNRNRKQLLFIRYYARTLQCEFTKGFDPRVTCG